MVSAFSIPQAKRDGRVPDNPGPGQYNPENSPTVTKKVDPRYSIGRQRRDHLMKSEVPGPGSYENHEIKAHLQKEPAYSMRPRGKDSSEQNPLGPGAYQAKYDFEKQKAPAYSMRPRAKSSLDNHVPGPGNYEPFGKSTVMLEHAAKFGHEKRDSGLNSPVPGPGSYNYEGAFNRYSSKVEPAYLIGSRLSDPKGLEVPGPGTYENNKNRFSKIGGIISRDLRLSADKNEVPGPGSYNGIDSVVKNKNPSFSLPKNRRESFSGTQAPGPGQYESPQSYRKFAEKSPQWPLGHDKRFKDEPGYVPGPGNYNPHDISSKRGSYIGNRLKDVDGLHVPGPGTYESSLQYKGNKSQMYSVGKGSRNEKFDNAVPGPGSYNSNEIGSHRNIKFPIDKRLKDIKSEVPGPGQYELKPHFADVPKYLLPNKP